MNIKHLNLVTVGGGSGQSRLLSGLRTLSDIAITAVCGMSDSGGSTARLSSTYGLSNGLGDISKCIVGLCPNAEWQKLLLWRFGLPKDKYYTANLSGHSIKNLLLGGLETQLGQVLAIDYMGQMLQIAPHKVLPSTLQSTTLCAKLYNSRVEIRGEALIDAIAHNPLWDPDLHTLEDIFLSPKVSIYKKTKQSIAQADFIILSPGDLFTSL